MRRIPGDQNTKRANSRISRREAVERAEAYLLTHLGAAVSVAELCRVVGLRERALRNAFYDIRGLSPKQYTLRLRLYGARRDLCHAPAVGRTTVASIAARYGFFELGRFAGAYKAMFGEAPSATLRSAASSRFEAKDHLQEHANAHVRPYDNHA